MSKQTAHDLIAVISRQSLMIADNLALDLTAEDLEYIYQSIGLFWLGEQVVPHIMVEVEASGFRLAQEQDSGLTLKEKLQNAARRAVEIRKKYE